MHVIDHFAGFPIWKLTHPVKLSLGMCLMLSGAACMFQELLVGQA
jgi:hypothetical protein